MVVHLLRPPNHASESEIKSIVGIVKAMRIQADSLALCFILIQAFNSASTVSCSVAGCDHGSNHLTLVTTILTGCVGLARVILSGSTRSIGPSRRKSPTNDGLLLASIT